MTEVAKISRLKPHLKFPKARSLVSSLLGTVGAKQTIEEQYFVRLLNQLELLGQYPCTDAMYTWNHADYFNFVALKDVSYSFKACLKFKMFCDHSETHC